MKESDIARKPGLQLLNNCMQCSHAKVQTVTDHCSKASVMKNKVMKLVWDSQKMTQCSRRDKINCKCQVGLKACSIQPDTHQESTKCMVCLKEDYSSEMNEECLEDQQPSEDLPGVPYDNRSSENSRNSSVSSRSDDSCVHFNDGNPDLCEYIYPSACNTPHRHRWHCSVYISYNYVSVVGGTCEQ